MRSIAFGEILWDIIGGEYYLGGAPFNFAAHLAQYGWKSYIISRVGRDELGKKALIRAEKYGVGTELIQRDDDHKTGTVDITITNGQPDYVIHGKVAFDFISYQTIENQMKLSQFDVFYFGSLVQRSETSAITLKNLINANNFKYVFYDVNLRKGGYSKEILLDSLSWCNILKLNIDEVYIISTLIFDKRMTVERFSKNISIHYSIPTVIITAGGDGCYLYHDNIFTELKGIKINLVDGVGAGDAFSASFMFQFLKKGDAMKAARIANKVGAFVASKAGPIPDYSNEMMALITGVN